MATYDLTVEPYRQAAGYAGCETNPGFQYRKFLGSELKTLKDGTVVPDAATHTFKIAKLGKGCVIPKVRTIVTDADDTAINMDIGYTDGTNGAVNTFEDAVALNSTGVTDSADDIVYFPNSGSNYALDAYLTITVNRASNWVTDLDDATEFIVCWWTELIKQEIATALTTPV